MSISKISRMDSPEAQSALQVLFDRPPILVEIRFPGCATSPDWYLVEDEEELKEILSKLAGNAELYLSRVWDLKNARGSTAMRAVGGTCYLAD